MKLVTNHIRIYALHEVGENDGANHSASPINLPSYPKRGTETEIHIGSVPTHILEGLKVQRAYIGKLLRGGVKDTAELRHLSTAISEQDVLGNPRRPSLEVKPYTWFVTIVIKDQLEVTEDTENKTLGVATKEWAKLDSPDFQSKYEDTLDQLSVQVSLSIAPWRYRWTVWKGPLVFLPTQIALRPPQFLVGRARVITASPIDQANLSNLPSNILAAELTKVPLTVYFYQRAIVETDRIERFFDAFRGLETLCTASYNRLKDQAAINVASGAFAQPDATDLFRQVPITICERLAAAKESFLGADIALRQRIKDAGRVFFYPRSTLRMKFSTMALALNPEGADKDLDNFTMLNKFRNSLAHGLNKVPHDKIPDEEAFELLHQYLDRLR